METNPQLELAFNFLEYTGTSIFLTGKAGTGKTTFLRELKRRSPKRMIVVAPTGVAAINAGGVTIHSFFQLPFGPYVPGGLNHPQLQSLVPKRGNRDVFRDERIRTLQKGAGQIRFGDKNLPVSGKECPDLRVCGRREAPDDDEIHGRMLTGSSCPGPYTCPPAPPPGPFRFPRRAAPAATPAGCRRR